MKTKTIYLNVRIDYSYDEEKVSAYDSEDLAMHLAVRPNYNSVGNGVFLDNVECINIDDVEGC